MNPSGPGASLPVDLPVWAWLSLIWLVLCTALALGIARWFKYMRDEDEYEERRW